MSVAVIIPWRERHLDPLRSANLHRVQEHWQQYPARTIIADDGREGVAQFNRSAAYNRAVAQTDADVLVFTEADILISSRQVDAAVDLARAASGLVVPFSEFLALSPEDSVEIRAHRCDPNNCVAPVVKGYRGSIGAVNVMSRQTYDLVGGYDEHFEGAWYDDDAMLIAFNICAGPTRWVDGPAYHLYHWSGGRGKHLSPADRAATARNRSRLTRYRRANTAEQIRALTCG